MATYADEVLADNPVAYWRLGEASGVFVDSMVGNDATATGTPTRDVANTAMTGSNDDGGVAFPTSSDYITAPDSADLDLGDGPFSIEMWLARVADTGALEIVLSKGSTAYAIGISAGDKFELIKDNAAEIAESSSSVPADGSWHHYVATRSGTGTGLNKIYVDGVDRTVELNNTAAMVDTATALQLGRDEAGDPPFLGRMDEVAIYKTVLTSTRIAAHFAAAGASGTSAVAFPWSLSSAAILGTSGTSAVAFSWGLSGVSVSDLPFTGDALQTEDIGRVRYPWYAHGLRRHL